MVELSVFIGPAISAICAFAGSWLAFSTRLAKVETKLDSIEKKQDKHNNVIERVYKLESELEFQGHDIAKMREDMNHYHR